MELPELIEGLSRPAAWPRPPERVEVVQTHASVVFLAGDEVYKIKKPVDFGFLDYSSLEKRRRACEAEVRLNWRLAPSVYLGTAAVTAGPRWAGEGEAIDWAVHMRRLPEERTLRSLLGRGELDAALLARLARKLAAFFASAEGGPLVAESARFECVERNCLENFAEGVAEGVAESVAEGVAEGVAESVAESVAEGVAESVAECVAEGVAEGVAESVAECVADGAADGVSDGVVEAELEAHAGGTMTPRVRERFRALTVAELAARRSTIEERAARGLARDGHGDLRLDHVYEIDGELLVIDCIEFNDRFRHQDPLCDVAFLVMELGFAGRPDLARSFSDDFLEATGEEGGRALLPLYVAYRHAVRGKVRSLEAAEDEVGPERREKARRLARAHFLAGLGTLAAPSERPALVLVGGPPGCGKSTLARGLASQAGFERISSDETRKRLAGLAPLDGGAAPFGEGIYTPEWTDRCYGECLRLARAALEDGRRVVVDASFGEDGRRLPFFALARELGLPALWFDLQVAEAEAARRLSARGADASDASLEVQARARARFEAATPESTAFRTALPAGGGPDDTLERVLAALRAEGGLW